MAIFCISPAIKGKSFVSVFGERILPEKEKTHKNAFENFRQLKTFPYFLFEGLPLADFSNEIFNSNILSSSLPHSFQALQPVILQSLEDSFN